MRPTRIAALLFPLLSLHAQVLPPGPSGVGLGHWHFHTANPPAHVKFWTEVFGAKTIKIGGLDRYKLPGVIVVLDETKPDAGMEGTTVPSVGMKVRDLKSTLEKAKAVNAKIVQHSRSSAVILGPDDIRVEITQDPHLATASASDSITLNLPDTEEAKRWYANTFGAAPGKANQETLPGVRFVFTKSASTPAGTKGHVLDHIGLEIRDLRTFTKNLAATGQKVELMYLKLPDSGIAIGFVTDPWGTYIEFTEGLVQF